VLGVKIVSGGDHPTVGGVDTSPTQTVLQHFSNGFIWIRWTCDYIQLNLACRLVVGLWLGLDLVSGWSVFIHMYLCDSRL